MLGNLRARLIPRCCVAAMHWLKGCTLVVAGKTRKTHCATIGHDLVNLRASFPIVNGVELVGRALNLTGARYAEIATFTAVERERLTPGAPRMVYLGVQANWPGKGR